jgi:hypothetical protein
MQAQASHIKCVQTWPKCRTVSPARAKGEDQWQHFPLAKLFGMLSLYRRAANGIVQRMAYMQFAAVFMLLPPTHEASCIDAM